MTNLMNWNEALEKFNLNYTVEKRPVMAVLNNGDSVSLDDVYSIVRTDTGRPLPGVSVGKKYRCIQTSAYAEIGNKITQGLQAKFINGGTLMHGRGLFLQAKMPDCFRVQGTDDKIDKMLTFITSHDGSLCFTVLPTMVRLFCENQMNALMHRDVDASIKAKHTINSKDKLNQADQYILKSLNAYRVLEQKINWLSDQRFSDLQMDIATRKLLNIKIDTNESDIPTKKLNILNTVKTLFVNGKGQHMFQGTAWAGLNAITEYCDHERFIHKNTNRFESNLVGSSFKLKQKAFNVIESML